jgi:hypothetical protein
MLMRRRFLDTLRTIGIALGLCTPLTPEIDAGICVDYAHAGQPVRILALDAATPSAQTYACISNTPLGSVLRAFVAAERLTRGDLVEISRDGQARRVRSRLSAWRHNWPLMFPSAPIDDTRVPRVTVYRTDDTSGVTWTEDYR